MMRFTRQDRKYLLMGAAALLFITASAFVIAVFEPSALGGGM